MKKLGLTALAGSLVATSVSAADLGVTGSWSWSWDSNDSDESGNPMSMGDSVTFALSGETDQGWTAAASWELDAGNFDDQKLSLDFGDGGKVTYGGASITGGGIGLVDDYVPAADSAVYTLTSAAAPTYGVARGASGTDNVAYGITVGDITVNAEAQKGAGTSTSWGVQYAGIDNLTIGLGTSDISPGNVDGGSDSETAGLKYAIGGITLGYQVTEVDKSATDEDAVHYGASFAVNDDLTISYGRQTVDLQGKGADEINSGASASYTMGSMSAKVYVNQTDDVAGASGTNSETKGITLSIAF